MNIFKLLTKKNVKIFEAIDQEPLHIRDIADKLKISPATVHKFIHLLKKNSLITETKHKNRILIHLNRDKPAIKQIKKIINFNKITNTSAYKKLKKIGNIGFYGSFSEGTNDNQSDLDIWIQTDKKELELRPIIKKLESELKVKVNPLILTKTKINSLKKNDLEFYIRLRLTSVGDLID